MKVAYDYEEIMNMIDSTLLKPVVLKEELEKLCSDAVKFGFKSVVVNPVHVKTCKKILKDTKVKVCTVAGFPLGEELSKVKLYQVKRACKAGAEEIDFVLSLSAAKAGDWKYVGKEVKKLVKAAKRKRVVKVILEASYLTDEEIVKACQVCVEAGARFVKTGTGYAGNATPEQVMAMSRAVKAQLNEMSNKNDVKRCEIKAAAGIKTFDQAREMAEYGATRIGTSSAADIAEEGMKMVIADEKANPADAKQAPVVAPLNAEEPKTAAVEPEPVTEEAPVAEEATAETE